ncbi:MAG: hypothetical protein AAF269_03315 [Pseudomonadota bacterium]
MATLSALRDAMDLANLIAASDDTGNRTLNVTPAGFKLDLVKGHAESPRSDLFGMATIVEVDIPEAEIVSFSAYGAAAGPNGLALRLPVRLMSIVAMVAVTRIADRAVAAIGITEMQGAIAGLYRNAAGHAFARFAMVGQRWCGEEQRRRKGKRGCSRFHDTIYHGCRNTQAPATERE